MPKVEPESLREPESTNLASAGPVSDFVSSYDSVSIAVSPYVARALGFDLRNLKPISISILLKNAKQMTVELPETSAKLADQLRAALGLAAVSPAPQEPTP